MFATLFKSIINALKGIVFLFRSEWNMQLHLVVAIIVIAFGWRLDISKMEWGLVVLAIGLVLLAEGLNTALEKLADAVHPDQHPAVGKAKDMAAGAVLLAAVFAAIIGLLIFGKYIVAIFV